MTASALSIAQALTASPAGRLCYGGGAALSTFSVGDVALPQLLSAARDQTYSTKSETYTCHHLPRIKTFRSND